MKRIVALLTAFVLCIAMAGCAAPDISGPKATIERYYLALNNADFDGMVACVDNTTATTLNGSIDLLQGLLSSSGSETVDIRQYIKSLYPSIATAASSSNVSYQFVPTDIAVSFDGDTRATARTTVNITVNADGQVQEFAQSEEFPMIKEGGEWKIDLSDQLASAFGSALDIVGSLF